MKKTIENKNCKKCSINFEITGEDLEFYKKVSPKFDWKVYEIPAPTLCSDCRQQRRLVFRNDRTLYNWISDNSWKRIISMFSPDKNYTIYEPEYWLSDENDFLTFWQNIENKNSFFIQFKKLNNNIPKRNIIIWWWSENCEYVNWVWSSKDCYLIFNTWLAEKCYYSNNVNNSIYCVDCSFTQKSQNCFYCIDCQKCFDVFYWQNLENCSESFYLKNCISCQNCFWCFNLSNKKYFIFNEEYSKEEYFNKIKELFKIYSLEKYNDFSKNMVVKSNIIERSENVLWDKIKDSKNVKFSFEINDCENIFYSVSCKMCKNCFLCEWLQNKQYCILNKQYTKEEYNKLIPKIIEKMKVDWEWWEFFSANLSPFWYNETVAQEYFPLNKEEILKQNFNYSDYEPPFPKVEKIIPAEKLPKNIVDIPEDILNWAIECEVSKKPFKIISQELEFYRKHNLPIPRKHPDIRHLERMRQRNPRKLFDRKCTRNVSGEVPLGYDECWKNIKITYSSDREEIVICEDCYNKKIY